MSIPPLYYCFSIIAGRSRAIPHHHHRFALHHLHRIHSGSVQLTAYYRGAMGILLVYDITDERSFGSAPPMLLVSSHHHATFFSFEDIRNWIRNIEQHASEGVNKILIGNKCDMLDKKVRRFHP
jgi:hypothetical protein